MGKGEARQTPVQRSHSPASAGKPPRRLWRRIVRQVLSVLWAVTPLSLVFGAAPTFVIAAIMRRSWWFALAAAGYASAYVVGLVLISTAPTDASGVAVGAAGAVGGALLGLPCLFGLGHALAVRRTVFALPTPQRQRRLEPARPLPRPRPPQRALVRALEARELRKEARDLLESDPALAEQLGIGRPDLHRGFDDGGLVDVNHAPPETIANVLGLGSGHVRQIVEVRGALGGFTSTADLEVHTDLPAGLLDRLSEQLVFLSDS
jgi:hypothetical protein